MGNGGLPYARATMAELVARIEVARIENDNQETRLVNEHVARLLQDLDRIAELDATAREAAVQHANWLGRASTDDLEALLAALLERPGDLNPAQDAFAATIFRQALVRPTGADDVSGPRLTDAVLQRAAAVYRHFGPQVRAKAFLLCWFTASRSRSALETWVGLLTTDPPTDGDLVAANFGPLFQHRDYDPAALFPRLLDGLMHVGLAVAILDLSNFLTREKIVPRHPAAERAQDLALLLAGLVGRLSQLEAAAPVERGARQSVRRKVDEGVSLAISLCDALALSGDRTVVGKIYQALELSHRRLRAEAAAALARLGEASGGEVLIQLAAEPTVRLRVLAYAEELGLLDRIDAQFKTEQAKAESDLALWLAQPGQMGLAPNRCELVDSRMQVWPGYDAPVECFLFRFVYVLPHAEFANIGIAGPLTHAFASDLADLPPEDIYAAFAGWHAESESIYELPVDSLDEAQQREVKRLERRLRSAGYDAIVPQVLGFFFGDPALVATVVYQGAPGVAIADHARCMWWPRRGSPWAINAEVAHCIYRGRRLLQAFN